MSVEVEAFLDTNVLVYAVAPDEAGKHRVARDLVQRGFETGAFAVSTQVLLELYVTTTRKIAAPLSADEALGFVRALCEWQVVPHTPELVTAALERADRLRISPWDAAILEAARGIGCTRVLSEDLGHGVDYGGVRVENPFAKG
jgi:predicted nucleic acid-binding protein